MGVRILHDGNGVACLYDSTTDIAFGPVFRGIDAEDQARHFSDWLSVDARTLTPAELEADYRDWSATHLDSEYGELTAKAAREAAALS